MKTRIAFALLAVFLLLGATAARAAGEPEFGGTITLRLQGVSNEHESAKSQEYRDLQDGVAASAELHFARGAFYLEIDGRNFGLDDQSLHLRGGEFGSFKYSIFYDQTPHNYSFGARTFFTGVGTGELEYFAAPRPKNQDARLTPTVSNNVDLWNRFDYAIQRKEYGSSVEMSLKSPSSSSSGRSRRTVRAPSRWAPTAGFLRISPGYKPPPSGTWSRYPNRSITRPGRQPSKPATARVPSSSP